MIFSWVGACCAGVVVIHIATMHAAVVLVVKALDWSGGLAAWVMGAIVAGVETTALCAPTTFVAAAAVICVLVATVIAAAAAICVLVATTTIVSAATVSAASAIVATTVMSTAASATWALLVVDDARWGLAISNGLAEHLELPLDRHDVGRVGSE